MSSLIVDAQAPALAGGHAGTPYLRQLLHATQLLYWHRNVWLLNEVDQLSSRPPDWRPPHPLIREATSILAHATEEDMENLSITKSAMGASVRSHAEQEEAPINTCSLEAGVYEGLPLIFELELEF
eukprot:CAMPEP_0183345264 /NCGR_PEP_ID=MMETSP0164_2-20130417/10749_1 /TAXON_ID=221442 /ORGANISM="Coccolithus pelagicus ssp braarudi, Strain PLY182g" /LENGTH=125 /DNA_ID=CAMNT_0025516395 /DNA_START=262 /DNA_END=639 /DNA_ORIENTATION=-